jgi:hypothetical protein
MGLRYHTLVGPIRADFAYRLPIGLAPGFATDPSATTAGVSLPPSGGCFGIGTQKNGSITNPEPACAIHISVGEAF